MSKQITSSTQTTLPPIVVEGARVHNLKKVDLKLPRKRFIVITGLSGSGKSSLAFHTLFVEGQRRYIESLNPYVRQFLGKLDKPAADKLIGIPPTIGLSQKERSNNPRARVSTSADIYPYLRILFFRIGKTYDPKSGKQVKKDRVEDVLDYICSGVLEGETLILAPLYLEAGRSVRETLEVEQRKGFSRLFYGGALHFIEDLLDNPPADLSNYYLLIDRLLIKPDKLPETGRLNESIEKAFFEGEGSCLVHHKHYPLERFNNLFQANGVVFEEPSTHFFSFNSAQGACKACSGYGRRMAIDRQKVIPKPELTIRTGAISAWKNLRALSMSHWYEELLDSAEAAGIPLDLPYERWSASQKERLWRGSADFQGLDRFFESLQKKIYKIQYRIFLARYRGYSLCPDCQGTGVRQEASYVKIGGKSVQDLLTSSVDDLILFFEQLELSEHDQVVAKTPLEQIQKRLSYLQQVGLGYLTLHRTTDTLSGGEYQRIKLTRSVGASLVDALYILDEPTTGLDIYNTTQLVKVLRALQEMGNTILVVEHEKTVIEAADQIIEMGPKSGAHGGNLVFQGSLEALKLSKTYTGDYLSGRLQVPLPVAKRHKKGDLRLYGMRQNNLKNIDLKIPLGVICVLTGQSGSGKSTIVDQILYPALKQRLGLQAGRVEANFERIEGDFEQIKQIAYFSQNPLGRSARSNPATYLGAYQGIRELFVATPLARERGYSATHFSFNTEEGRCPVCQGSGQVKIDMQFMADVTLTCETCKGARFQDDILQICFKGKQVAEVLALTLEEALDFFKDYPQITSKIEPAVALGLGYMQLGQACSTLSGGEAQRLKLSTYLQAEKKHEPTLFIFDELTRGLHTHDISFSIQALQALADQGHSVLVIEHNLEIIQSADWVIELGVGGGKLGGHVTFTGSVEDFVKGAGSYLAKQLAAAQQGHSPK